MTGRPLSDSGVPWTLAGIEHALRASWAADTCSADDLTRSGWDPDNPAWGHCDITALVVNDLFGGDLVVGECGPVLSSTGTTGGIAWTAGSTSI